MAAAGGSAPESRTTIVYVQTVIRCDKLLSHMGQKLGRGLRAGEARKLGLGQAVSKERTYGDMEPVRENDGMNVACGLKVV
jgi:ribosomal protein L13E